MAEKLDKKILKTTSSGRNTAIKKTDPFLEGLKCFSKSSVENLIDAIRRANKKHTLGHAKEINTLILAGNNKKGLTDANEKESVKLAYKIYKELKKLEKTKKIETKKARLEIGNFLNVINKCNGGTKKSKK